MKKQFLKFCLIGLSNGAVNFLIYNLSRLGLEALEWFPKFDYVIAGFLGFTVSVLWSFCFNRRFVFNSESEPAIPWPHALLKMYLAYGFTGVVLGPLLSLLLVRVFAVPKEILTVLNDLICLPVNFLLNKFWTFRKNTKKPPAA